MTILLSWEGNFQSPDRPAKGFSTILQSWGSAFTSIIENILQNKVLEDISRSLYSSVCNKREFQDLKVSLRPYPCWYESFTLCRRHHFHVHKAGESPIVRECMVQCKSCRQHFHTIIAARKRRNGCEVPHMPLSIVLTFHSPTGPQQPLPCGTQNAVWRQQLTEGEYFDESPSIPRKESLLEYCFPNISLHVKM